MSFCRKMASAHFAWVSAICKTDKGLANVTSITDLPRIRGSRAAALSEPMTRNSVLAKKNGPR